MAKLFVLLDCADGATTTDGSKLTPDVLAKAAALLTVFLNGHVAKHWGIPGGAVVRAGTGANDIQPNEWPFRNVKDLPDAPGAIAFHSVDGVGVPSLYDAITLSDSLFGPGGWLQALAHELVETIVDPAVNRLCADGQGHIYDLEVADPVEVQSYEITLPDGTTGSLANFVLPSWYTPNAAGPWDYVTAENIANGNAPSGPFQVAPGDGGNYASAEPDPNATQQINAEHLRAHGLRRVGAKLVQGSLARREAKKRCPASRSYRRGLRLPEVA